MPITPEEFAGDPDRYYRAVMVETMMVHAGHRVEIALYGDRTDPHNAAIECLDCNAVLIDWDQPLMDADDESWVAADGKFGG